MIVEVSFAMFAVKLIPLAHKIARFALHLRNNCIWFNEPPLFTCDLIEEDVSAARDFSGIYQ